MNQLSDPRSFLPSVDKVLAKLSLCPGMEGVSHNQKVDAGRLVLDRIRSTLADENVPTLEEITQQVIAILETQQRRGLRRVVNGTGIILHTGLGRAVLPKEAFDAIADLDGCCDLQIDLEEGTRGQRDAVVEDLLKTLTGAEAATVVNNNAAATLLVLAALCRDKELIVSRGQLIEIGGSFRLPDVIAQSGAHMVEIGTTNKTHLRDYVNAITDETRVLLRVNPSNYRIIGFTSDVSTAELVALKSGRDLIVVDDLGCGAFVDLTKYGLPHEPTMQESIAAGADVVLASGDKLLSGPQAGIIIGRKEYIAQIRKHPLARALRVGKFTIAALEATLRLYLNPDTLLEKVPTLRMIARRYPELNERATALAQRLSPIILCEVTPGESACGGGSLPDSTLETALVALRHERLSASELARRLRTGNPSVIPRIQNETVFIDVRTLVEGDEERVEAAVRNIGDTGC
ncbi:MAG: L-seryl-tRNA(Sec) selenium transferase [bacterium]